jgi:hypothetical protein
MTLTSAILIVDDELGVAKPWKMNGALARRRHVLEQ